jgi:two-component system, NtrC family, response regulator HydG
MEKLMAYSWPGNVRELRNAVEYAFVLCPGRHIHVEHLPPKIISTDFGYSDNLPLIQQKTTDRAGHELIRALRQAGGNQSKAASIFGVSRVAIWKRLKKYGIDPRKSFS